MSEFWNDNDPFEERKQSFKRGLIALFIGLIIIATFVAFIFGMGWVGVGYKNTVGVADASADRNVFKANKSYVEGMVSDLAKYKYELTVEKDQVARKAIVDLIIDKYANFDTNKLDDVNLQSFLKDVKNGKYNDGGIK